MNLTKFLIAAMAAFSLLACGSSDPKTLVKEGYDALNSGHSDEALAKFDEALAELKPEDPLYLDAKMGVVESLIANQPKKATTEFLDLARQFPDKIGEKQFINTSGKMVSARQYMDALDLVDHGIKSAGGESPGLMVMIDRIKKEAASDNEVTNKLKSMGYL